MSSRARGEGEDRSDTAWESSFNWLTSRKQCQGQNHSSEADVVPSTCKLVLSEITRKTLSVVVQWQRLCLAVQGTQV